MSVINCKLNTEKVPRDKYFKGANGTYLDFVVAERREPDQYGNTHYIYIWDKATNSKIFIGGGKVKEFNNEGAVLPPGTTGIEDADVVSDSDPLPF